MFISLQLVAVLREVKYLTIQGQQDVPPSAAEVFSQSETFRKYVGNLDLIVSWYNQILATVLPVEFPLLEEELKGIDEKLALAESTLSWHGEGTGLKADDHNINQIQFICHIHMVSRC
uniref:Dynein heavy chain tail domain-containing protein n=1 Tax=Hucho hucho TaxID=62062 RepID=A0A4W5LZ37_9TELE